MDRPRVLLVGKRPLVERLGPADLDHLRDEPRVDLDGLRAAAEAHGAVWQAVTRYLHALAEVRERVIDQLDPHDGDGVDLVVTVGGDGTVLAANGLRADRPILAVNSDPARSVGHFTRCTAGTFPDLFAAWRAGTAGTAAIPRLQVAVSGDAAPPQRILNDCLFTSTNPAAITRYMLEVEGRHEAQQSSGVWISTAAGSTAAIHSAGHDSLPDPRIAALLYRVREPFHGRGRLTLLAGSQLPPRGITLTSTMPGIDLYLDGPYRRLPLAFGASARIEACAEPLRLVEPRR